mmetsp:Transcript_19575/g.58694  ORF Transcript_19575/g.58694 Transcript_19575/m.58694 type:complete len:221 (+) Transcript_19575:79-741(+)
MGRDYYGLLDVARTATALEIKAGYRLVAMKWHPQKNPQAKVEAEQRFRDIAEAYDVLISPLRRQRYDQLGESGLKFPPTGSAFEPYQYVGDPFVLFTTFFHDANPLAASYMPDLETSAPTLSAKAGQDESIELELECTLRELQDGNTRRLVIDRTRIDSAGVPYQETKAITVPVRPGWVTGMRVVFKGEGNHTSAAKQPGDLAITIREKTWSVDMVKGDN